jgi:hypothetical protein
VQKVAQKEQQEEHVADVTRNCLVVTAGLASCRHSTHHNDAVLLITKRCFLRTFHLENHVDGMSMTQPFFRCKREVWGRRSRLHLIR